MIYSDGHKFQQGEDIKTYWLNGIYAHGELQKWLGYDIVITDDIEIFNDVHGQNSKYIKNVKVMNQEGKIKHATLYLWFSEIKSRGLICMNSDESACTEAFEKFKEDTEFL